MVVMLATLPAQAAPFGFEIVGTPTVFTSPFAFTTSDIYNDQRAGGSYTHDIGLSNWAADFTVAPQQWVTDEILILLGLDNSTELVGVSESETVMSYTTQLRLTGDAGARAQITGSAYASGSYNQLIGAVPSGDARSRVRYDYSILGVPGLTEEYLENTDGELAALAAGSWLGSGTAITPFEMLVGETISINSQIAVRSFSEVNEACVEACIPYTDICTEVCVAGVGFAFAYTDGIGGIQLTPGPISEVPEPGSLSILIAGLLAMSRFAKRTKKQ